MHKTLIKLIPIVLLGCFCLAGCGPTSTESKSDQARILEPDVPADMLGTLVNGNNSFALNLYQGLRSEDGNLFYSPYSISLALAMTYGGARGETEAQMAQALHFDLSQEELHPAFNRLDLDLAQSGAGEDEEQQPMQLNIANAVWAQQGYPFLPEYLDLLALNYGAGLHQADFATQAEPTRKEINLWVSDRTEERIKDLIAPGMVDASTRMVLVNAIYFKADWQSQFDANNTHPAPFYLLDGSDVQVDIMSESMYLPYLRGENYQAVELPYAGGSAAMDIIMPDDGQFAAFEAALDWSALAGILSSMQPVDLHLIMPKFSYSSEFELAGQLAGMGMPDAFCSGAADFSGMDGMGGLCISAVIHQAFVAVDEQGTEAAAATAVIMLESAMIYSGTELTIDHPFFFLIRDLESGQILFAGRVLDPAP
jgi:serpin B